MIRATNLTFSSLKHINYNKYYQYTIIYNVFDLSSNALRIWLSPNGSNIARWFVAVVPKPMGFYHPKLLWPKNWKKT